MANFTNKFHVSYDSETGDRLIFQKADEKVVFNISLSSLYFHDAVDWDILIVVTTTGSREGYTNHEFTAPTKAREGLAMMGNPSPMDYINMVCSGMPHNSLSLPRWSATLKNVWTGHCIPKRQDHQENFQPSSYRVCGDPKGNPGTQQEGNPGGRCYVCKWAHFLCQYIAADKIYHAGVNPQAD